MPAPAAFLDFVDKNADKFIGRLADAVAIPRYCTFHNQGKSCLPLLYSISGDASRRNDVFRMAAFLDEQLQAYGVETKLVELGDQEIEGQTLKLPPAILGRIGKDPKKKTVLIYGHFDVQPVSNPHNYIKFRNG